MTAIISPLPNDLANGTVADASQVMANFNQIVSQVNSNVPANTYQGSTVVVQLFTSSGTYTPTAGMRYCLVELVGGGGAGGKAIGGPPPTASGGGGGAGGEGKDVFNAATIGAGQTITIGAGGSPSGGNTGGTGGTTSFGALLSATGGLGGRSNAIDNGGGDGGTGTGSGTAILKQGQAGESFYSVTGNLRGGQGGSSSYGGGATGLPTNNTQTPQGYGQGGVGGFQIGGIGTIIGYAGNPGMVRVTEYF